MSEGELVFCILAWKLRSPVLPLLPPFFLPLPFPAAAERLFICVPHPKWCGPLWLSFERQLVFIGLPRGVFGVGLFYVVWCPTRGTDERQQQFARSGLWAGCRTAEPGPRKTQESLHWFHQPLAHCFHPAKFINRHCACLLGSKRRPLMTAPLHLHWSSICNFYHNVLRRLVTDPHVKMTLVDNLDVQTVLCSSPVTLRAGVWWGAAPSVASRARTC